MQKIVSVEKTSPLYGKVREKEYLVSINDREIRDVLDYMYFSYDSALRVVVESEGNRREIRVEKPPGDGLGLNFDSYLMDDVRSCNNRCIFCFVDQLPRGLRRTLYFKDDDSRLSLLDGNYVTLTNLSDEDIDRIIKLKIMPINISIHATDGDLRAKMMGNPEAARGFELMKRLVDGGISINCQIVLCPGINDGGALRRTMEDLEMLFPALQSVSLVPVGLTRYRERLAKLTPFNKDGARAVLEEAGRFGDRCMELYGIRLFYASDELFLKASLPVPAEAYYDDYPQLQNGVGMMRLFEEEFFDALTSVREAPRAGGRFSVATGASAQGLLEKLLNAAAEKFKNINGWVIPIRNDFFGHDINVSGLITGGDLISQLRGIELGERLLIPKNMLVSGGDLFLDNIRVSDVEKELGVSVVPLDVAGDALLKEIIKV